MIEIKRVFILLQVLITLGSGALYAIPEKAYFAYDEIDSTKFQNLIDSGDVYIFSNTPKAESFYNLAFDKSPEGSSEFQLATLYTRLGIIARIKSDYLNALSFQQRALKIYEERGDSLEMASVYHNIGFILRYQKSYSESVDYYKKAIVIRSLLKDSLDTGISYNQLGVIYRKQNKLELAESTYNKALDIFSELGDDDNLFRVKGNLASLYHTRKEYKKALEINLQAIPILKKQDNKASLAIRYSNIAKAYEKLKDYKRSISYLDSAIYVSQKHGHMEQLNRDFRSRSRNYSKIQEHKLAFEDFQKHSSIKDSIFSVSKAKEITKKLLAYDFQKQREVDSLIYLENKRSLEFQASSQRNQKYAILTLLLCMTIITISIYNNFRSKQRIRDIVIKNKRLEADQLSNKLAATKREAERIISEKSIIRQHKENLKDHLQKIITSNDKKLVFNDLKLLTARLENQAVEESVQLVYDKHINQHNIAFEKKLIDQYPKLSKSEREMCSLIRSKLSTKDIVNLKGCSLDSVHSIRYRIRKKLELEKGTELQQFLEQLEV